MRTLNQLITKKKTEVSGAEAQRAMHGAVIAEIRTASEREGQRNLTETESGQVIAANNSRAVVDGQLVTLRAELAHLESEQRADNQATELANQMHHTGTRTGQSRTYRPAAGQASSGESWLPSARDYQELQQRTLGSAGSVFVQTEQSGDFVDRLRAHSALLGSNIRALPVPKGSLRIPKITASVTVAATAENAVIVASDPAFGSTVLTLKKFTAATVVSNEAMADSNPHLRAVVGDDLVKQVATFLDTQMLAGSGVGANLLGVRNWAGVTPGPAFGVNGRVPTLDDFAAALTAFETAGGSVADAVWLMAPRTWGTIRALKDSQNRYQVNPGVTAAEERSLFGVPVETSANIGVTETAGTSSDTSWAALVDKSQVVIGYGTPEQDFLASKFGAVDYPDMGVEVAYSSEVNFFSDQTAIRVIARFDIQPLNAAATVVITGIRP